MLYLDQSAETSTNFSQGLLKGSYVNPEADQSNYRFDLSRDSPATTFEYKVIKRTFDIAMAVLISPFVLCVGVAIALCILIDSPGPIFFSHRRIHRGGRLFRMWKFRTMCCDATQVLEQHLEQNPDQRKEWILTHKLRVDPRVSTIGAFLRRTSLDELPQIWNVFTGRMSFVGPRPIVTAEIIKYGPDFIYYTAVKPGITGLWQTSGRSTLTYAQRVALDRFYVENWSLWFELKILIRTIRTVFRADGAY